MKEEEMKIKAGKPYEELTTEEKGLIVDSQRKSIRN